MAAQSPEREEPLPADAAGLSEVFASQNDMSPIVAIGGLLSDRTPWQVYSPVLAGPDRSPASDRFMPILKGGLASFDDMLKHAEEGVQEAYEQHGERLVIVSQSLGGPFATEIGADHPEWVKAVVCLAGVQAGLKGEKPAAWVLKHLLGNPDTAPNLQEDSALMREHKEKIASEWSPDTSLHLISPTTDILVPIQQGLKLELPEGQEPEKRVVVPRLAVAPFVPRRIGEYGVRKTLGIPEDAELIQNSWWPADHFNIALIPAVISYVRGVRREAAGNMQEQETGISLPAAVAEPQLAAA